MDTVIIKVHLITAFNFQQRVFDSFGNIDAQLQQSIEISTGRVSADSIDDSLIDTFRLYNKPTGPPYLEKISHWISAVLLRIYFKYQLSNAVISTFLGIFNVVLQLIAHPLSEVFPKTLHVLIKTVCAYQMDRKVYTICPNESCNQLYAPTDAERLVTCTNTVYGKVCGYELGYKRHIAFSRMKWTPHKSFHFVAPSTWIKHMLRNDKFCKLLHSSTEESQNSMCMKDIYDGKIWKDFQHDPLKPSEPFLSNPNNIGLLDCC